MLLSFVVVLFITGCSNAAVISSKENLKDSSNTVATESRNSVPSWLYEFFKAKFKEPDLVKPENITFLHVRMNSNEPPQIAAYLTIDRLNGVFALFELQGDKYKEVYVKEKPIYGLQVLGNSNKQYVAFIAGLGGTGYQDNSFYLLGYTSKGYKEVWKGIAERYTFGPKQNYIIIGAINFHIPNEQLIYSQFKRTYKSSPQSQFDINKPDKTEKSIKVLKYDENLMTFKVVD